MSNFCKICSHNHINYADSPIEFESVCKFCGQDITKNEVLRAEDSRVIELEKAQKIVGEEEHNDSESEKSSKCHWFLEDTSTGIEIAIPQEGAVLGRNSLGREILSDQHISKEHIKITVNERRHKVYVEDISTHNVTMLNGKRMIKGPEGKCVLEDMDRLMLYNRELIFRQSDHVEDV